ncbi:hypothetical protein RAS_08450 [Rickettsia asiatica]|uniref:Uncharacterized protein n=1 Tax=Rickettsia asiatica TaxID=238800 RepID=A0A510G7W2_9RICK|nr:hypothetical protein RAS_08450 [Rickettsia asiatica]
MRPLPLAEAPIAAGKAPLTGKIEPSNDNSPIIKYSDISSSDKIFIVLSIEQAIARSKWLPSFTKSAGAKFIKIFLVGSASPIEDNAALTRSFDSAIVLSASPTIV